MAIVNEIKCARCDRKYSGVRSRCPYCGARRIGRGKYSENSDNAKGKMLISVLIMAAFTVAAGVLLFTAPVEAVEPEPPEEDPAISDNIEDDIDRLQGLHPAPPVVVEPEEPEEPAPPLEVTSVTIVNSDGSRLAFGDEFSLNVGASWGLQVRVEPPGADREYEIIWTTSNRDVFDVNPVEVGAGLPRGYGVNVTALGVGSATLTAMVGDIYATVTVRVNR